MGDDNSVSSLDDDPSEAINQRNERIEAERLVLKEAFEKEREKILNALTTEYKEQFGQIGFTKWSKKFVPVLILSPYDLPPGEVRNTWVNMFEKMKSRGTVNRLSYLVFWYGTEKESEMYGFVAQSALISWSKEESKGAKGAHRRPAGLQKKIDSKAALSASDQATLLAYAQMEEDLEKEPAERKRGLTDFQEGYDIMSDSEILEAFEEESSDFDDDLKISSEKRNISPPVAKKKKAKPGKKKVDEVASKKKKRKSVGTKKSKDDDTIDGDEVAMEESTSGGPSKKQKVAKPKGRKNDIEEQDVEPLISLKKAGKQKKSVKVSVAEKKKKKSKGASDPVPKTSDEDKAFKQCQAYLPMIQMWKSSVETKEFASAPEMFTELSGVVDMFSSKFMKHHKLRELLQVTADALTEENADLPSFTAFRERLLKAYKRKVVDGFGNSPGDEGAVNSDGIGDEEDESEEDDEKDAEYAAEAELSSNDEEVKPKAKGNAKDKVVKKASKAKHKIERQVTEKTKKDRERKAFRECEQNHLPLIGRWERAIEDSDVVELGNVLVAAGKVVDGFSATFIKVYELGRIFKSTKLALKNANQDLAIFNELRVRFKTCFNEKMVHVPKGFEPKKSDAGVKIRSSDADSKHGDLDNSQRSFRSISAEKEESSEPPATKPVSVAGAVKSSEKSTSSFRVPLKHGKKSGTDSAEASVAPRAAALAKPDRKKFSLGNLMRQPSVGSASLREGGVKDLAKVPAVAAQQSKVRAPSWVTGPPEINAPIADPRSFALEFLLQTASHFPKGTVDTDSLARSLEAAIYDWAAQGVWGPDDESWIPSYWTKVHALVAAICGKREKGTLVNLILQGRFSSPNLLLELSDEDLGASFEGHPMTI